MNFFNFLVTNCDSIAPFIPIAVGVQKKTIFAGANRYLSFFLIAQVIFNTISGILDKIADADNIFLYQLNAFSSLIFMTFFFRYVLRDFRLSKYIIWVGWVLIALLGSYILFLEPRNIFNSHSYSYTAILIVLYSLVYFYHKIINPTIGKITGEADFWFVTGLFIYYSAAFLIFISYRMLTEQNANPGILWKMHNLIFVFMCVYITIGFICKPSAKTY